MDFIKITDLLGRYRDRYHSFQADREMIARVISEKIGYLIEPTVVEYEKGEIKIRVSPAIRQAIFIQKTDIEEAIAASMGVPSVSICR
jgi:hypothetical protein